MINRRLQARTGGIIGRARRRKYSRATRRVCKRVRADIGALFPERQPAGGTGICGRLREMRVVHGRWNRVHLVEREVVFGALLQTAGAAQVRGD
jgi:hypothetical protein